MLHPIQTVSRIHHAFADPAIRLFSLPKANDDWEDESEVASDVDDRVSEIAEESILSLDDDMDPQLRKLHEKLQKFENRLQKLQIPKNQAKINEVKKEYSKLNARRAKHEQEPLTEILPKEIYKRDPRIIHTCRKILGLTQKGIVKPALALTTVLAVAALGVMIIMAVVAATVSSLLMVCSFIPATSSVAVVLEAIQSFISSYALWLSLGAVGAASLHLVTIGASISGKLIDRKALKPLEDWKRERMITMLHEKNEALQTELQSHQITLDSSHGKEE